MAAPSSFEDARPPEILVFHVLNPVLRRLLRSHWGRFVRPFALLEFDGRVTGRRLEVPVGWHPFNGNYLVVTPAQWRRNFTGGHPAIIHHSGRSSRQIGTLVEEPDEVAAILRSMTEAGFSLRRVGIRAPSDRPIGGADVSRLGRAIVRFGAPPSAAGYELPMPWRAPATTSESGFDLMLQRQPPTATYFGEKLL